MIKKENVLLNENLTTKEECILFLAKKAEELGISTNAEQTIKDLNLREGEMNTAIIEPLAIPHTKAKSIKKAGMIFIRLKQKIDWGGVPVNLIIALFSPKEDPTGHVQMLAKLSRRLAKKDFRLFLEQEDQMKIVKELQETMKEV